MQAVQEQVSVDYNISNENQIKSAQQTYEQNADQVKSDSNSIDEANQKNELTQNGPPQANNQLQQIDNDQVDTKLQNQDVKQEQNTSSQDQQQQIITPIDDGKIKQKVLETEEQINEDQQVTESQEGHESQQDIKNSQFQEESKTQLPQVACEVINTNDVEEEVKEMVSLINPKRQQIQSELLLKAKKLIEGKDQLKVVQTQKKYDVTTRQTLDEQGCYVNYCQANCVPGIYTQQFTYLFDNWVQQGAAWQDYIKYSKTLCKEEGDYEIFHDKVKPGFPLSERNFISCVYKQPVESDGSVSVLISGQDCDQYINQIEVKKGDAKGVIYLTYIRIEPMLGKEIKDKKLQSDKQDEIAGCKISWINSMTMGGSIPSNLQNLFGGKVMHKTVIECLKVVSQFDRNTPTKTK